MDELMWKKLLSSKKGSSVNKPHRFVSNRGVALCNYTTRLTLKKSHPQAIKSKMRQALLSVSGETTLKRLLVNSAQSYCFPVDTWTQKISQDLPLDTEPQTTNGCLERCKNSFYSPNSIVIYEAYSLCLLT